MLGMSEEQFWRANPRIIKVWQEAWKKEQMWNNSLIFNYVGSYVISAMSVAVSNVMSPLLTGKQGRAKYLEQPIELFELTPEEQEAKKQAEVEKAQRQFMEWAKQIKQNYRKEGNTTNGKSDN